MYDDDGFLTPDTSECIDCHTTEGVSMQWPGYGTKNFPRCDGCAEARIEREEQNKAKYFSSRGFDEMDAGETFEDPDGGDL